MSEQGNEYFKVNADDVLSDERERLFRIKGEVSNVRGLALSGGGIRSACFALGVVHALLNGRKPEKKDAEEGERVDGGASVVGSKAKPLLGEFHFLSTVSGGGYLGAALTWLRRDPATKRDSFDALEAQLDRVRSGSKLPENANKGRWLNYLRQHGNYLLPRSISLLDQLSLVLRCMFISLVVYGGFLVAILALLSHFNWIKNPSECAPQPLAENCVPLCCDGAANSRPCIAATATESCSSDAWHFVWSNDLYSVFIGMVLFLATVFVLFSLATRFAGRDDQLSWHYPMRAKYQSFTGSVLSAVVLLGVVVSGARQATCRLNHAATGCL
jgi:hypothetical protein